MAEQPSELAVVCDVCSETNDAGREWCSKCRSRLPDGVVPRREAERETTHRKGARSRRRILGWTILVGVGLALVGWWSVGRYGPVFFTSEPSTTLSVVAGPGDWPMYQRDPAHTGFAADVQSVPRGVLKWRLDTGKQLFASPAVVDGVVYIGTGDKRLLALDGQSGDVIWEVPVGDSVHSTPAVAGDFVFFSLRDGRVVALDKTSGSQVWEYDTGSVMVSSPTVTDGFLYVGAGDGTFYALDAANGKKIWSFSTDRWISASPAVFDDVVAIVSYDQRLYVFDRHNGRHKLRFVVTGSPRGSAAFGDEHLFIGDPGGTLKAVDWHRSNLPFDSIRMRFHNQLFLWGMVGSAPKQRGFVWGVKSGSGVFSTPAVGGGKVFVTDFVGRLVAVDEGTGELLWTYDRARPILASPSATLGVVLAGDTDGTLHAVDAGTGELLWEFRTGAQISATPVLAGGLIYLASEDGTLYALE
ncbi:MAG: PQQ-binding-like beta-propeller repeat protein [Chloroflexi bacterium]|nr:PQQ-binding-like beta-propeller repeat protein [Chloroflexota bacterium]